MAQGERKQYPRFQADTDILSHTDFVEAFAKRDERLGADIFAGFVPISFPRMLEIAVEQNRESVTGGHSTDFRMRGREILERAIIEQGAIAGAQRMVDFLFENGDISQEIWQNAVDQIEESFDSILLKYAEQSAFFLRDLERNISRKKVKGRPSITESSVSLASQIDSGLLVMAAKVTRDDLENSPDAMMRRLIPIVRDAVETGYLPRGRSENGESLQDAVDRHMKRLRRLSNAIHEEHSKNGI
jgi:hypothetical protein